MSAKKTECTKPAGYRVRKVIVCDEVREEKSGKFLLVGVYNGLVAGPRFPAVLPVLSFWVQLDIDVGQYNNLRFAFVGPDGRKLFEQSGGFNVEAKASADDPVAIIFEARPCSLPEPGQYKIQFGLGKLRTIDKFRVHARAE